MARSRANVGRARRAVVSNEAVTYPTDGLGYTVRKDDLDFLQIAMEQFEDFLERRRPLGMQIEQYKQFIESLYLALEKDRIYEYDLRLQGSAAHLFSGPHKTVPWSREELIEEFRHMRGRVPQPIEVDLIQGTLNRIWPPTERRPSRRLFDMMVRVGVDTQLSDYDIQLSSDEVVRRTTQRIVELGIAPSKHTVRSQRYNFIRKDLVTDACPSLALWATLQTDILGRAVTIAAFPSSGPPRPTSTDDRLSSHFKDSDWVLEIRQGVSRA